MSRLTEKQPSRLHSTFFCSIKYSLIQYHQPKNLYGKTNVFDALPDCVVSTTNWNPVNTAGDDEGVGVGDTLTDGGVALGVGVIDGVAVGVGVVVGQTDGYEMVLPNK